ncbi:MAG TPA: hypothetical protein VKD90_08145 [Gemmataceae bacterium]|nr:hypothetical protein [Gemmataceae bacterium]
MKTLVGILLTAAALGAVGCTTTEKSWVADEPPPLAKSDPSTTTVDPVRLPAGAGRVSADDIDETNYSDAAKRLQTEFNNDKRALSKAGK